MSLAEVVDRNPLADAIEARLRDTVEYAHGYVGEPADVPTKATAGGQAMVEPYWVLHPGAGTPSFEQDLGDTAVDLRMWVQVNCVGDSVYDVLALVTKVNAALYRWTPVVAGHEFGPLKPPPGYDPGPPRNDTTEKPHRFWVPLQFAFTATVT